MVKYRKKLILCLIFSFVFLIGGGCAQKDDGIRLRIIANSNDEIDQQNKIEVKNIVKQILQENLTFNPQIISAELKKRITKEYKNTIVVEYRPENFPAKSYHGQFIKSGIYDTIVITIGKGEGQNFWTILYPDFFHISFDDDHEIEYRSYIYDHIINNK